MTNMLIKKTMKFCSSNGYSLDLRDKSTMHPRIE